MLISKERVILGSVLKHFEQGSYFQQQSLLFLVTQIPSRNIYVIPYENTLS